MKFDEGKLKNIGTDVLDALTQGFKAHAEKAAEEARDALIEGAQLAGALAADFASGRLTLEQAGDFARKVGVAVETKLAAVANEQARAYVKNVLATLLGGVTSVLGAFK